MMGVGGKRVRMRNEISRNECMILLSSPVIGRIRLKTRAITEQQEQYFGSKGQGD